MGAAAAAAAKRAEVMEPLLWTLDFLVLDCF